MKKLFLTFFTFSFLYSFSQNNNMRILAKQNKDDIISDTLMMSFLKLKKINLNEYNVIFVDSISSLTSKYLINKTKFTLLRYKFYFTDSKNYIERVYEKKYNLKKRKKTDNKFIYCYRSLDKNNLNLFEIEFYILE